MVIRNFCRENGIFFRKNAILVRKKFFPSPKLGARFPPLPVLVSIALHFAFRILSVFHSLLSAIGFQSYFFFTADVSPPIRSTLHLLTFLVSFQAWDWLWHPMLWSQRRR